VVSTDLNLHKFQSVCEGRSGVLFSLQSSFERKALGSVDALRWGEDPETHTCGVHVDHNACDKKW